MLKERGIKGKMWYILPPLSQQSSDHAPAGPSPPGTSYYHGQQTGFMSIKHNAYHADIISIQQDLR
jgi:hypothetical protein